MNNQIKRAGLGPVALTALWSAVGSILTPNAAQALSPVAPELNLEREAQDAAARAGYYCSDDDLAARTYKVIMGLQDVGPYQGTEIAVMLDALEGKGIVVRAPTDDGKMFDRIGAVFVKGENGERDVLVINDTAHLNERFGEYIQRVLKEADNMEPGSALVLDQSNFGTNSIVSIAPEAKRYTPDKDPGAPFTTFVRFYKPGPGCGPV